MSYLLAFDIIILKQLKKLESKQDLKFLLQKLFDRLEEEGPEIGKNFSIRRLFSMK